MLLAALALTSAQALATEQKPERIVLEGREKRLFAVPLESAPVTDEGRHALGDYRAAPGTNLHRGYLGSWRLADGRLSLVAFEIPHGDQVVSRVPLAKLFPGSGEPVPATWFTGDILVEIAQALPGKTPEYLLVSLNKGVEVRRHTLLAWPTNYGGWPPRRQSGALFPDYRGWAKEVECRRSNADPGVCHPGSASAAADPSAPR